MESIRAYKSAPHAKPGSQRVGKYLFTSEGRRIRSSSFCPVYDHDIEQSIYPYKYSKESNVFKYFRYLLFRRALGSWITTSLQPAFIPRFWLSSSNWSRKGKMVQPAEDGAPRQLTGEEAALYDRQIRLWGVDAQRRLSASSVLIAGQVTSFLVQELAKNLLLTGIQRIGLYAHSTSTKQNAGFLGGSLESMIESLREMNPLVDVCAVNDILAAVPHYTMVCASGMAVDEERGISSCCRDHDIPFFSARTAGIVGWVFIDLGSKFLYHVNIKKEEDAGNKTIDAGATTREETDTFIEYGDAVDADWGGEPRRGECGWHVANCLLHFEQEMKRLPGREAGDVAAMKAIYEDLQKTKKSDSANDDLVAKVASSAHAELPPVAAIVGGIWGREVVKALSRKDAPLNNFFFFNAQTSAGSIEKVGRLAARDRRTRDWRCSPKEIGRIGLDSTSVDS